MYLPPFLDLRAGFSKYFCAVPATTDALRDEVFRIRHDVYCRELKYEPLRPDGREIDDFDAHSAHCLLRAVDPGRFVGCIRLIVPNPLDPNTLFPFEKTCAATLDRKLVDPALLARNKIAEVSRLAVISAYRRRKGERDTSGTISEEDFGSADRPRFPYVPVGLYLGMIAQAHRFGIEKLFVLTEPRLARHLSLLGVRIERIGGPVEHRGRRVPSMMSVPGILKSFGPIVRPLYDHIAASVDAGYGGVQTVRMRLPADAVPSATAPPFGAATAT
jgi:N-acyl amino acid synthase of PEP-CTERM/exosortase system